MPLSPRAIIFLAIIVAGGGAAIWWLYDDVVDFAESLGQSECQSAQYEQTIKDQNRQLQKLRKEKKRLEQAREQAHADIEQMRREWRRDRREWRERLDADPEARQYLDTDIPDAVDRRMCELLSCPDRSEARAGPRGPESGNAAPTLDARADD